MSHARTRRAAPATEPHRSLRHVATLAVVATIALVTSCAGASDTASPPTVASHDSQPSPSTLDQVDAGSTAPTTAPATSVDPPTTVPAAPSATAAPATSELPGAPARLAPPDDLLVARPTFPGEGHWQPIGPQVAGEPGMYATTLANGAGRIGVVWIDPGAVRGEIHPGTTQPGGSWPLPPEVASAELPDLAATFNGGFKFAQAGGGFEIGDRQSPPLQPGGASLALRDDGVLTVGQWGRDVGPGDHLLAVRQNLHLLVDGGQRNATATQMDHSVWGATLGGAAAVHRSGIGVRPDGALVYIGGPALSAAALGDAFVRVGAVRAMELDINTQWVQFNWFTWDATANRPDGHRLLDAMVGPPNRFTTPDSRDFVALFAR